MTTWINIKNTKDWFKSKEQFELVKRIAEIFNAQEIRGINKPIPIPKSPPPS